MITTFPSMCPIDAQVRDDIVRLAAPWRAYQQFSFAMMVAFDPGTDAVAELEGNLVMRTAHPVTGVEAYTLCGRNGIAEVAATLLQPGSHGPPYLHLVPQDVARALEAHGFCLERDEDASEYILELEPSLQAALKNGRGRNARRFTEVFLPTFEILDLADRRIVAEIEELTHRWRDDRLGANDAPAVAADGDIADLRALRCLLSHRDRFALEAFGVRVGGCLAAFDIQEAATETSMSALFAKALRQYPGCADYLLLQVIRHHLAHGRTHLNLAEDLGIPTLRRFKKSWHPAGLGEKFTVRR